MGFGGHAHRAFPYMSPFGYIRNIPSLADIAKDIAEDYKKSRLKTAEQTENTQDSNQQQLDENSEESTLSEETSVK